MCKALFALLNIVKEIILVPGYIENWIVIIDLEGLNNNKEIVEGFIKNNIIIELIDTFELNYPNYLEKIFLINFSQIYLDLMLDFRIKLSYLYPSLIEKIVTLSKDEFSTLQEYIDKSQIELKYGGSYPNNKQFWPPKNIINSQILKFFYQKKDIHETEFIYLQESEEECPKKKLVPKFKELSFSPLRSEREYKMNINKLRNSNMRPQSYNKIKFHQHQIFEKTLAKQFLFDDWESVASSSSRYSEKPNPLSNRIRKNKFIEDYSEKPLNIEQPQSIRTMTLGGRESTKELCQIYFNEKFQRKMNEGLFYILYL